MVEYPIILFGVRIGPHNVCFQQLALLARENDHGVSLFGWLVLHGRAPNPIGQHHAIGATVGLERQ